MAKAGFWLQGARGKLKGSSLKGQPGGATIIAGLPTSFTNPNTAAQQGVRSSFKLISQLASQLADIIAIPREGAKSSRNIFTSINYPKVFANEAGAGVALADLQLTKSNVAIPPVGLTREAGEFSIWTTTVPMTVADKFVTIIMRKSNGALTKIEERIVDNTAGDFELNLSNISGKYDGDIVVFLYGLKFENEAARTKYANLNISTADEVAQVIVNRTFTSSEAAVTKTSGAEIASGAKDSGLDSNKHLLTINKGGLKGSVSGGGYYAAGATVTLQFTPADNKQHFTAFAKEDENGEYTTISNNNPATFTMPAENVKIVVRGYTTVS